MLFISFDITGEDGAKNIILLSKGGKTE